MTVTPFAPRPKLTIERRGGGHRQKTAMPKWSHQQELDSLMGKEITITFNTLYESNQNGSTRTYANDFASGMLVNADAFAIQLAQVNKSVMTYYKHAIRSYELRPTA